MSLPYSDILFAQEATEDQRLFAQAQEIQRASQKYSCPEDNETTPWLKQTRWPELFRNRPLDIITATAQRPGTAVNEDYHLGSWKGVLLVSPAENEAKLRILMQAVDHMFTRAEETLSRTSYRLRCWLKSYHKDTFYPKAVTLLPAKSSRTSYLLIWKQFLCYIFRVFACSLLRREELYNLKFQSKEIQMMNHILGLVEEMRDSDIEPEELELEDKEPESEESEDEESEDEDSTDLASQDQETQSASRSFTLPTGRHLALSEAVFQLSMMFWTYRDLAGDMTSSVLIHFVAVLGIHRHSLAYKSAYLSTSYFSRFIWLGRLLFLEYALPLHPYTTLAYCWPARETYPDQANRLEEIRTKYLLRGGLGPFSEILELKAFAKSIVKKEGQPGTLSWASDGHSFTLGDNQQVQLRDFCRIHFTRVTEVAIAISQIMLDWTPSIDLTLIHDDLTCRIPGWSFLNHPKNNLTFEYKSLLRRAWTSSFRGSPFVKKGHWLLPTCSAYLQAGTEVEKQLWSAIHLTAGLPGRGSEICSIRLHNTALAIRHIFIRGGQILVIISYNKARTSNNYAFYIVRYLPLPLGLSVFKYIVYVRPFLDFLANQLHLPQYQHNEFFFPDPNHKKQHLSSEQASKILRSLTQDLTTPWNLSLYRQASLAIAKRYISDLLKKHDFYNNTEASNPIQVLAAGVGHHPRTLVGSYAVEKVLPARLQPELLDMYYRLSTLWQSWNCQYYRDHCLPPERVAYPSPASSSPLGSKRQAGLSGSSPSSKRTCNPQLAIDTAPLDGFIYNPEYKVLICITCESIIQPAPASWYTHLNSIHRLRGTPCKSLLERFATYDLCPFEDLPRPQEKVAQIPGLKVQEGFRCCICSTNFTIHKRKMDDHIRTHKLGITPKRAWESGKYSRCLLQTFSLSHSKIRYFEVEKM
jgi:hypothetical protein